MARKSSSVRQMGMWLLLASLGMLFAASLVGFTIVRLRTPETSLSGSSALPPGLWVSTALLVVLSLLLVVAERAARTGTSATAFRMLSASLALGVAFLGVQTSNWMRLAAADVMPEQNIVVWGFYVLTFLHALHVVAGLVPLIFVTLRAYRGLYTPDDYEGIHLVALYWHFLLVTWVAIFVMLRI